MVVHDTMAASFSKGYLGTKWFNARILVIVSRNPFPVVVTDDAGEGLLITNGDLAQPVFSSFCNLFLLPGGYSQHHSPPSVQGWIDESTSILMVSDRDACFLCFCHGCRKGWVIACLKNDCVILLCVMIRLTTLTCSSGALPLRQSSGLLYIIIISAFAQCLQPCLVHRRLISYRNIASLLSSQADPLPSYYFFLQVWAAASLPGVAVVSGATCLPCSSPEQPANINTDMAAIITRLILFSLISYSPYCCFVWCCSPLFHLVLASLHLLIMSVV